jgi:hypothetical protein
MTNPTTPQPVQEPAGAVEALRAMLALFRENAIEMTDRNGQLYDTIAAALASLPPVTQAWRSICDSEWVNIVNAPIVQEQGSDSHAAVCEAFKLIEAKLRELNEFRSVAPQEAVERQPLTERIALLEAALTEVLEFQSAHEGPHIFDWGRWRRIRDNTPPFQRAYPGIGPATQEKAHE